MEYWISNSLKVLTFTESMKSVVEKQATYLEGITKKILSPSTAWLKKDKDSSSTYINPRKI